MLGWPYRDNVRVALCGQCLEALYGTMLVKTLGDNVILSPMGPVLWEQYRDNVRVAYGAMFVSPMGEILG
jgi:hypothetical protein